MLIHSWFMLVIFALASFRLTRLLVFDKITRFIRAPFIEEIEVTEEDGTTSTYSKVKGEGLQKWIGELLSCYWCTGVWVSAILLIGYVYKQSLTVPFLLLFAVAGLAAIIEVIVSRWSET